MFEIDNLTVIIDLQNRSFDLLRWVKSSLIKGTLDFSIAHGAMSTNEAAKEWISRHLQNIPEKARPTEGNIDIFAHLFASYITTSFDIIENPKQQIQSKNRCFCKFCSYLGRGDQLKLKRPSKKSNETAQKLKQLYLEELAGDLELSNSKSRIGSALDNEKLQQQLAMATWGAELLRRTEWASQGPGVYVLWREFAWKSGNPNPQFELAAQDICNAEEQICSFLKAN